MKETVTIDFKELDPTGCGYGPNASVAASA